MNVLYNWCSSWRLGWLFVTFFFGETWVRHFNCHFSIYFRILLFCILIYIYVMWCLARDADIIIRQQINPGLFIFQSYRPFWRRQYEWTSWKVNKNYSTFLFNYDQFNIELHIITVLDFRRIIYIPDEGYYRNSCAY